MPGDGSSRERATCYSMLAPSHEQLLSSVPDRGLGETHAVLVYCVPDQHIAGANLINQIKCITASSPFVGYMIPTMRSATESHTGGQVTVHTLPDPPRVPELPCLP